MAGEVRACEFRDDRNGRARWLERRAKTKADQRAIRVQKGRERAAPSTETRAEVTDARVPSNQPRQTERPHNEQPTRASKPRIVSGPMCTECGVRFSGQLQLDEHRRGRAHEFVASVVKQESLVALRVSAESLVDLEKVGSECSPDLDCKVKRGTEELDLCLLYPVLQACNLSMRATESLNEIYLSRGRPGPHRVLQVRPNPAVALSAT